MSDAELWSEVLVLLKKEGGLTLAQLGQRLWGVPEVRDGRHARPAGKVLHAMAKAGLVKESGSCAVSGAKKWVMVDRGADLFE